MSEWLSMILAALFVENIALVKPSGADLFLGTGKKMNTAFGMGLCVTFVMIVSTAITRLLIAVALRPLSMEYLSALLAVIVITLTVQLMDPFIQKHFSELHKSLGLYMPLIAGNSALLLIAVGSETSGYSYLMSVVYALFAGLGFTVASVMLSMISERCAYSDIPKAFRGVPAALIGAGLLALVFTGFKGFGIG